MSGLPTAPMPDEAEVPVHWESVVSTSFRRHNNHCAKTENSPVGGPLNAVSPILCLMYFSSKCHHAHRSSKVGSRQINVSGRGFSHRVRETCRPDYVSHISLASSSAPASSSSNVPHLVVGSFSPWILLPFVPVSGCSNVSCLFPLAEDGR